MTVDPYMPGLVTALCVGLVIGGWAGYYWAFEKQRRDNRKLADQMMASVGATRSRRKPEDMLEYDHRQRTQAPNNGKKARQAIVRPRRVFRRPDRRH